MHLISFEKGCQRHVKYSEPGEKGKGLEEKGKRSKSLSTGQTLFIIWEASIPKRLNDYGGKEDSTRRTAEETRCPFKEIFRFWRRGGVLCLRD